jgi:hypothetical protein
MNSTSCYCQFCDSCHYEEESMIVDNENENDRYQYLKFGDNPDDFTTIVVFTILINHSYYSYYEKNHKEIFIQEIPKKYEPKDIPSIRYTDLDECGQLVSDHPAVRALTEYMNLSDSVELNAIYIIPNNKKNKLINYLEMLISTKNMHI